MLVLDAMCAHIKDNLITLSDLRVVDRGKDNICIIMSHNIQYKCVMVQHNNALVITIGGVDVYVSTANQVLATAERVVADYQSQLDEIGEGTALSTKRPPTLTLELTGLSPDQVARIITITQEQT